VKERVDIENLRNIKKNNKLEKTIALFENKKFENSDTSHGDYREWYLALAYLKTDKRERAKEILTKISKTGNHQNNKH
jgi:hypothetical protein